MHAYHMECLHSSRSLALTFSCLGEWYVALGPLNTVEWAGGRSRAISFQVYLRSTPCKQLYKVCPSCHGEKPRHAHRSDGWAARRPSITTSGDELMVLVEKVSHICVCECGCLGSWRVLTPRVPIC